MKRNGLRLALAVSLMLIAAAPANTPESTVRKFYDIKFMGGVLDGVPDANLRANLKPVVTRALAKAFEDAAAGEARHLKATKNEEPPLVEGDILSSLFEGPTAARVDSCAKETGVMTCRVALVYTSPGKKKPVTWTDTLLLKQQDGGWRVDDIVYGGTWAFGPKGKLTDLLKHVAAYKP